MDIPEMNEGVNFPRVVKSTREKDGRVRISKEVISEIATQALLRVIGVRAASDQKERQRSSQGVNISVEEFGDPSVVVDAFIETKYGLRIPDIAWYVQESIKNTLEQNTGYKVRAVNVFVQAVYFEEVQRPGQILMQRDRFPKAASPDYAPAAENFSVEEQEPEVMPYEEKPIEEQPVEEAPVEKAPVEGKHTKKDKTSIFGRSRFSDKEHGNS